MYYRLNIELNLWFIWDTKNENIIYIEIVDVYYTKTYG